MTRKEISRIAAFLLVAFTVAWFAAQGDEMCAVEMTDPGLQAKMSPDEKQRCTDVMQRDRDAEIR